MKPKQQILKNRFVGLIVIAALTLSLTQALVPNLYTRAQAAKITYYAPDFTLKLPASWKGKYLVKKSKSIKADSYVAFYSKKCYKYKKQGWLFSIARYADTSYEDVLPAYKSLRSWNGIYYVAVYPTDVQYAEVSKAAARQYAKLNRSVEKVVNSIKPR